MNKRSNLLKKCSYWLVPPGIADFQKRISNYLDPEERMQASLCNLNSEYKDIHKGKRCFIVCSGPSVKKQNLLPLKNEITFFVSSGFLHPDYLIIQPKYHCTPDILLSPRLTTDKYIGWFREMDARIGSAHMFMSVRDAKFVEENKLFKNRKVCYLSMQEKWDRHRKDIYDLSTKVPGVQSVSIMTIIIAIYMGFSEIYLLGVDHDMIFTGTYTHFYDSTDMSEDTVANDGKSNLSRYEEFKCYAHLYEQYQILKKIAKANDIAIYNATAGGALDEFDRVDLESVIARTSI